MIHKLLAGKGRMKKVVSLLLCLALLGSSVISSNVTAEAESDMTEVVETVEAEATEEVVAEEEKEAEADESSSGSEANSIQSVKESSTEETAEEAVSMPAVTLSDDSVDGITVTVNASEGTFTDGVSMVVSAVDVNAFAKAVVEDCEATAGGTYTVYDAAAVEISFYDADGAEIQPATEVEVTLGSLDLNTGDDDLTKYAIIYHMDDDGNMEYIADGTPGESSYTFSASSFSTYGLIIASVEYGTSESTISGNTTVAVGSSITLTSNKGGDMGQDHSWTYTSSDGGEVTISNNGKTATVTGVAEGTVTITHTYKDGPSSSWTTETYTVTVTASGSSSSSGITYYHIDVRLGGTLDLTVNSTTEDKVDVTVNKVWNVEDGTELPDSITVDLKDSNGNTIQTATLSASDDWTYTWNDLTLDAGTYTVEEEAVTGYVATYSGETFTIEDSGSSSSSETYTGTVTITELTSVTIVYSNGTRQTVEMKSDTSNDNGATEYMGNNRNLGVTLSDDDYIELVVSYTYSYSYTDPTTNKTVTVTGTVENATLTVATTYANNACSKKDATDTQRGFDVVITGEQILTSAGIITTDEEVTITNTPSTTSITVTKEVTGNMGDTTKEFTFTLELSDGNGDDYTSALTAVKKSSDGTTENISLTYDSGNGYYSFTLADDESIVINVPYGYTYSVNENDYSSSGYKTTVTGSTSGTATGDVTISYVNDKDVTPDTGIGLDTAPYIATLFGVILFGAAALIRRRRRLL